MVLQIAEVVPRRRLEPGDLLQILAGAEKQVALRPADPPQPPEIALELRDSLELLVGGPLEHLVLDRVDVLVQTLQDREEGIGQRVEDAVENELLGAVLARLQVLAE